MEDRCLTSLLVFENTINKELVRSLHVYRWKEGRVEKVEREFVLPLKGPYVEMQANPLLSLRINGQVFRNQLIGLWRCMFAFHVPHHHSPHFTHFPHLLSLSRNPKLKAIPSLANDLQVISKLSGRADGEAWFQCKEISEGSSKDETPSKKNFPVLDQDLNCLPHPIHTFEPSKNEQIDRSTVEILGVAAKKKKRAASQDIARIALGDLVKYFGLPIVEASRNLKVGVTVLKRKCREFGIPRWPHRKIKSLDGLIRSLQEEAEHQKQENGASAMAISKRKRMLEKEKKTIERKPFMEIQSETKRFRQDVFKRRHRARAFGLQGI